MHMAVNGEATPDLCMHMAVNGEATPDSCMHMAVNGEATPDSCMHMAVNGEATPDVAAYRVRAALLCMRHGMSCSCNEQAKVGSMQCGYAVGTQHLQH